ncbi:hypothetical protein [Alkalinema sp. FACHB-956]|uniref:MORN repeat-containing protein n=1 Tax=Alkalinema sp. FACHB-956 TaxID=2692768 RepID=UPI001685AC07|nr:hypothetical protein [Alkalinema sp. FACHB-956]MBD2326628.1 hypothetical protein [Alkalinema sp. FACHB-956]
MVIQTQQLFRVSLLTLVGVGVVGGWAGIAQAQSGDDLVKPRCERRGGDNWICAYIKENPGSAPYKSYEGQMRNGIPNGRGILVYSNDDRYEGQVRNGIPNGQGMFLFANNDRYEGGIKNGQPHGQGAFTMANGDRYIGSVKEGSPHGQGVFTFSNGSVYSGTFYLGQAKGQGVFVSKGIRCQGVFFSSQLSGRGSCAYPAGSTYRSYSGELRGAKPEGRGVMVFADGKRFSGEFRDGLPFDPKMNSQK